MLKNPKRNFGWLPSGEFIAHIAFCLLFFVLPLTAFLARAITNTPIETHEAFYAGFSLTMLLLWLYVSKRDSKDDLSLYSISKRERYIKNTLIPFLSQKYGITIHAKNRIALTRLALSGHVNATRGTEPLENIHFMGWDEIEEAAKARETIADLGSKVYLVQAKDDGSLLEIPPVGTKEDDLLTIYKPQQNLPTLEETEFGIKNMIFDIISALPTSETVIRGVAPSNTEFPGVDSELRVSVDTEGRCSYSSQELKALAEDVVFNVRLNETALVVSLINTPKGTTYVSGRLVSNEGYEDVSSNDLKHMAKTEESETIIFLDDIKNVSKSNA